MRRNRVVLRHVRRPWLAIVLVNAVLATLLQGPSNVFAETNAVRLPVRHGPAPVKLPPSSGEPAPMQPKRLSVGEQPDRRTRYSSTRYNENHTFTTTVSGHPVNYRGRSGGWEPIDNTLVSSRQNGYAYQNGANSFQAQFKSQLGDDYLRWVVDGQAVSMSLQGASRAQASAKGSTIRYPGALAHVNAAYSVLGDGLEEVLELQDASAQASFQFLLKAPKGTSDSQQADGSWVFLLPGHAPGSFWLKPPFAYDSGMRSPDPRQPYAQMSVTQDKDGFQVTLGVDGSWLRDPSRRFPVFLDPTFAIQPDTNDATFDNNCASCTGTSGPRLAIGTTKSPVYIYRAALQFDLSAIPAGASISGANLQLLYDGTDLSVGPSGGNAIQIDAHRMTATWSAASTSSQVQFDSAVLSSVSMGPSTTVVGSWLTWDVTNTVNSWIAGTQPNFGLYLMLSSEKVGQGGPQPPAMSYPDPSLTPRLNITYSGDAVVLNQPKVLHANGAELTWSQYTGPSGARFQKYEVHRSLTSGFTPSPTTLLTATNDFAATSFRDTTAAPNQTFYYAIVANSSKGSRQNKCSCWRK